MTESTVVRPELHVAAGVLQNSDGNVLVAARRAGSAYSGALEFPGGKIAGSETPLDGLVRELREELGITVTAARWFMRLAHDYPEWRVHLYVWRVLSWRGDPIGAEGQPLYWLLPTELMSAGLLPADEPIVAKLQAALPVNELPGLV